MPYTATTPTIVLCDALVEWVKAQWKPKAKDTVARFHRGQSLRLDTMEGRQVRIIALGYDSTAAARGLDFFTHRIGVLTAEKYPDSADADEVIPIDWIDQRVDFVFELRNWLDFYRDGTQPSINRNLQTLTAPVEDIYDPDKLAGKLFWCEMEIRIQEQAAI